MIGVMRMQHNIKRERLAICDRSVGMPPGHRRNLERCCQGDHGLRQDHRSKQKEPLTTLDGLHGSYCIVL